MLNRFSMGKCLLTDYADNSELISIVLKTDRLFLFAYINDLENSSFPLFHLVILSRMHRSARISVTRLHPLKYGGNIDETRTLQLPICPLLSVLFAQFREWRSTVPFGQYSMSCGIKKIQCKCLVRAEDEVSSIYLNNESVLCRRRASIL